MTQPDWIALVNASGIQKLDVRPRLSSYVQSLWRRRDFILADAKGRAFRTNRNYKFWKFWIVAGPLLDALMYGALFGLLLKTSRGIENFVGFVVLGIVFFSVMNKLLLAGAGLIGASRAMIQTFSFPRASLVLSQTLRYVYDTVPAVVVAVLVSLAFQLHVPVSLSVLLVVPLFFLIVIFGSGLTFFVARLTFFFPDMRVLIEIASRAWMFGSGVFFSIERFATEPLVLDLMTANPAHRFLTAVRDVVLYGLIPSLEEWLVMIAWSFATFFLGLVFFWQAEERYVNS